MCGICGLVAPRGEADSALVEAMNAAIVHRGPDHGAVASFGYSGRRDRYGEPDRFDTLRDVTRADGAGLAVSRAAVDRVGLFDESLFAYVEDVDLSLRVWAAGFAVVFVPDAVVRHKGSASTGGTASTTNLYYSTRNTIVVSERHRLLPLPLHVLRRGVVVGSHAVLAASHPTRTEALQAVLAGWRDARAGRLGQRSSRKTVS